MTKNLLLFAVIAVLASTQAAEAAKKGSPKQDTSACECTTCLIENGICVTTQKPRQPIKKDGGAVKSKTR